MEKLRLDQIIVDHARKPKEYHLWIIILLTSVIFACLIAIWTLNK